MKNKKIIMLTVLTFVLGVTMLLGSSYSLIIKESKGNTIKIPKFNDYYQDTIKINIYNNKVSEYSFDIINESMSDVNYRIDIMPDSNNKINKIINYSSVINGYKSDTYNLSLNNNIIQNHVLNNKNKDTYKVSFFFSDIYDSVKPYEITLSLFVSKNNVLYATKELEKNHSNEIKKFDDEIRFTSINSHNYVWFNCDDNYKSGIDHCEKWRIIGSMNQQVPHGIDKFKALKIVKDEINDEISFNKDELNGKYDYSFADSYLNGAYYEKMSDSTKKLLLKGKWHIGDVLEYSYSKAYKDEQKEEYYAYIGLLSPSDYLAIGNSWLKYDQKILLLNKSKNNVNVLNNGLEKDDAYIDIAYVPCVYLRSDVSFIDGDGSINNPYSLGIISSLTYGTTK